MWKKLKNMNKFLRMNSKRTIFFERYKIAIMRPIFVFIFLSSFSSAFSQINSEKVWDDYFKGDFIKVIDRNTILDIADRHGLDSALSFIYFFTIPPKIDYELFNTLFSRACPFLGSRNLYYYTVNGYPTDSVEPASGEQLGSGVEGELNRINLLSFNVLLNKDQALISKILGNQPYEDCNGHLLVYVNDRVAYLYRHDECTEEEDGDSGVHVYEYGCTMEITEGGFLKYFLFSVN